jgi:hypothetical protein
MFRLVVAIIRCVASSIKKYFTHVLNIGCRKVMYKCIVVCTVVAVK